mmetsp:Transcript_79404/g.233304  ORF Transcript_79404/g.233304 Transcript_79404/m.233304 type:complete len:86 (-) Transcript_79404:63-320(-)
MLDLITLFSTVGLQQEMREADFNRTATLVIREDEGKTGSFAEEAAEQLSVAFDAFEGALSSGLGSLLGSGEERPAAAPAPAKKVA